MDGYRDERGAALERLEQLEAEEHRRVLATLPERRKPLEDRRYALLHPEEATRSNRVFLSRLFRYGAIGALLVALRGKDASGFPLVAAISLLVLVAWYVIDARQTETLRKRVAAVDAELAELAMAKVRVALPTELDAIHARIAVLEPVEEDDDQTARARERRLEMASAMAETRK